VGLGEIRICCVYLLVALVRQGSLPLRDKITTVSIGRRVSREPRAPSPSGVWMQKPSFERVSESRFPLHAADKSSVGLSSGACNQQVSAANKRLHWEHFAHSAFGGCELQSRHVKRNDCGL
jgi:hypothetical protein